MSRPLRVGITHGDINGISYEIIIKSLADEMMLDLCTPVIFGSAKLIAYNRRLPGIEGISYKQIRSTDEISDGEINVLNITQDELKVDTGQTTRESGHAAVVSLEAAVQALQDGDIDVLVTAPINKRAIHGDDFNFPGHTEYLESKAGEGYEALMILFDDFVRIALVTTHIPVSEIPKYVTRERIGKTIEAFDRSLRRDFGCERPKIAVLSLNPHCGDNGLLGKEEETEIIPAIADAKEKEILAFGPYAPDGFFGTDAYRNFDGVVAMYHDQGLAPFKALARNRGVNFTAGLPFVRTSPDHGTAYDIAGKGMADATSMREAIYKAIDIRRKRDIFDRASSNPLKKQYEARGADKSVDLTKEEPEL